MGELPWYMTLMPVPKSSLKPCLTYHLKIKKLGIPIFIYKVMRQEVKGPLHLWLKLYIVVCWRMMSDKGGDRNAIG